MEPSFGHVDPHRKIASQNGLQKKIHDDQERDHDKVPHKISRGGENSLTLLANLVWEVFHLPEIAALLK